MVADKPRDGAVAGGKGLKVIIIKGVDRSGVEMKPDAADFTTVVEKKALVELGVLLPREEAVATEVAVVRKK